MSIAELLKQFGHEYFLGYLTTLQLTFFSFIGAFIIGVIITVARICPVRPLRIFGNFYVQIFRNIPGAALLILLVYALPYLSLILSYYTCVLIATTLIPSAFMSEHLISGVNTIDKGQIEAARSLGMTFSQIISKIVIPQAVRSSILHLTNLLVATMLTTALASQVPLSPLDLTGLVAHINSHVTGGIMAFAISAFLYCATAVVIGQTGNYIDRKVRIFR